VHFFLTNPTAVCAACLVEHLDTDPLGVRMATIPGSPVVVLAAPWTRRRELAAGIDGLTVAAYVLAGPVDLEGVSWRVYAGESADFPERLARHARDPAKAFVNTLFVITSRASTFGKIHVQGLQFLVDRQLEQAGRAHILRGVRPSRPPLDPGDWTQLEEMLSNVNLALITLGCRLLEPARPAHCVEARPPEPLEEAPAAPTTAFAGQETYAVEHEPAQAQGEEDGRTSLAGPIEPRRLQLEHRGLWAHALALDGSVTIKAGSDVRIGAYGTMAESIVQARRVCCDERALVAVPGDNSRWRLVRDVTVGSQTFAARFVTGCHLDGRVWQPLP